MSDTPRTDAAVATVNNKPYDDFNHYFYMAGELATCSRILERELAAAIARAESAEQALRSVKQAEPVAWVDGERLKDFPVSRLVQLHCAPTKDATTPLYAAPAAPQSPQGEVTVTVGPDGNVVAVTRQDEEHRVLSVIWEKPEPRTCPHAEPFRYCPECKVSPCPIGLDKSAPGREG